MILNFEEFTGEFNEFEKKIIPVIIRGLSNKTKNNPIKGREIVKAINQTYNPRPIFSQPRLRKICNFIRSEAILPLIATSRGYYVSKNPNEIKEQIESLQQRAGAILAAAEGLQQWIDKHEL